MNYYFTSNEVDSFYLEDSDRRFFVVEAKEDPKPASFYQACKKWKDSVEGPPALFDYLLNVDTTGFSPYVPAPVTAAKKEMIETGRSDAEAWIHRLPESLEDREHWTIAKAEELWERYKRAIGHDRSGLQGFTKKLKPAGFVQWKANKDGIGQMVKELHGRIWITSKEAKVIEELNKRNEKDIFSLYKQQHLET